MAAWAHPERTERHILPTRNWRHTHLPGVQRPCPPPTTILDRAFIRAMRVKRAHSQICRPTSKLAPLSGSQPNLSPRGHSSLGQRVAPRSSQGRTFSLSNAVQARLHLVHVACLACARGMCLRRHGVCMSNAVCALSGRHSHLHQRTARSLQSTRQPLSLPDAAQRCPLRDRRAPAALSCLTPKSLKGSELGAPLTSSESRKEANSELAS